jgi:hypothetical protein
MNSCDYDFRIGTTTESSNTYGLTGSVTCDTENDQIHVGIWSEGNEAHEESRLCTIEIGEQINAGHPHITDNGDGTVTAKGTFTNIPAERHGLCLLDGNGTSGTAKLHIDIDIRAENAGVPLDIGLSDFQK